MPETVLKASRFAVLGTLVVFSVFGLCMMAFGLVLQQSSAELIAVLVLGGLVMAAGLVTAYIMSRRFVAVDAKGMHWRSGVIEDSEPWAGMDNLFLRFGYQGFVRLTWERPVGVTHGIFLPQADRDGMSAFLVAVEACAGQRVEGIPPALRRLMERRKRVD